MPKKTIAERPLLQEEGEVIHWMLKHASTSAALDRFIPTVDDLRVVGVCDCGCPSIFFSAAGQSAGASIIADAPSTSPEGFPVGLILWANGEAISELEVYSERGEETFTLPRLASLRTWEQFGKEYEKA